MHNKYEIKPKPTKYLCHITFVNEQQLTLVYVGLGEVQHSLHGVTLEGQVSIAGRGHHEVDFLWGRIQVLRSQIL